MRALGLNLDGTQTNMIISTENGHAGDEGGLMNGTIQAIKSKLNGNGSGRFAGMSSRQGERPRPQETFAETGERVLLVLWV